MEENNLEYESNKKIIILLVIAIILAISAISLTTYAFFSYYKVGEKNSISTGKIKLTFIDGENNINLTNQFPISDSDAYDMETVGSEVVLTDFTVTGYSTSKTPLQYEIHALKGDGETGKNRMVDEHVKLYLVAEDNGKGTITIQNGYDTANSETSTYGALASVGNGGVDTSENGEIYLAKGQVASDETTHKYTLRMWISDTVKISDTTTSYQYCASESECHGDRPVYSTMFYSLKIRVRSVMS